MSDDPKSDRSRAPARADFGTPDMARRLRALSAALARDREQSFVRLLTARPGWLRLPSLRARRRDQLRRAKAGVAVLGLLAVACIAAAVVAVRAGWVAWI